MWYCTAGRVVFLPSFFCVRAIVKFGCYGAVFWDQTFFCGLFSIIIDIILAGDNAVVIAMAVRALPTEQQWMGIVYGSSADVDIR